jgi:hypothetical protein
MKLIAHRGNVSGISTNENYPNYIQQSIDLGFDAEVDIRWIDGEWWLGHDIPQYKIISPLTEFDNTKVWWHCKNFAALEKLQGSNLNYFWHQEDDHTLTSNGYIWTYPGKDIGKKNIVVMPEMVMSLTEIYKLDCFGICSDYVQNINNNLKKEI